MAGLFRRLKDAFSSADPPPDGRPDARAELEESYRRQLDLLQQVRRGLAEVSASRRRIELVAGRVASGLDELTAAAKGHLAEGADEPARQALARRAELRRQLDDLEVQRDALQADEQRLREASREVQARVEEFRTRRDTLAATHAAAEATARITEAFDGLGRELDRMGHTVEQAGAAAARVQLQAAQAHQSLTDGGGTASGDGQPDLVERDLADLREALSRDRDDARRQASEASEVRFEQPPGPDGSSGPAGDDRR